MLTQRFSELRNACYASLRDEIYRAVRPKSEGQLTVTGGFARSHAHQSVLQRLFAPGRCRCDRSNQPLVPAADGCGLACACQPGSNVPVRSAVGVTLSTIAQAYLIAIGLGISTGYLVTRSRFLIRVFEPIVSGLFAIPITLFLPLFILIFGVGPSSKVAYGAAYGFFPIALNTIAVLPVSMRLSRTLPAHELRHLWAHSGTCFSGGVCGDPD
jgi:hypothetical protein